MRAGSSMWKRFVLLAWIVLPAAYLLLTAAGTHDRLVGAAGPSAPLHDGIVIDTTQPAPLLPLAQQPPFADAFCLTCHGDSSLTAGFSDGRTLSLDVDLRAIRDSTHDLLSCVTCHDTYEPPPPERTEPYDFAAYQAEATAMCLRCHQAAAQGYSDSAHFKTVLDEGKGATCIDCHSPNGSGHSIATTSEPGSFLDAGQIAGACGRCHEEARASYDDTSHGKVARFGDPGHTATCTTCHSDHAVRPVDDLVAASAAPAMAAVCGDCHDGADESFARAWPGHSEGAPAGSSVDVAGRAGFFVAAAVVAFGLVHVSLDMFRRWTGSGQRLR